MDFRTLGWLLELQRRAIQSAAQDMEVFEELVRELTPLLMVCDSGYECLEMLQPWQRFDGEIVVVGASPGPTFIFETMTVAQAAKYRPDHDVLVFMNPMPIVLGPFPAHLGNDVILTGGPTARDWENRGRRQLPPRKLGRDDYRAKNIRRPPSGIRGR